MAVMVFKNCAVVQLSYLRDDTGILLVDRLALSFCSHDLAGRDDAADDCARPTESPRPLFNSVMRMTVVSTHEIPPLPNLLLRCLIRGQSLPTEKLPPAERHPLAAFFAFLG